MEPVTTIAAIIGLISSSIGITQKVIDAVDRRAEATGQTRQEVFREVAEEARSRSLDSAAALASAASRIASQRLDAYDSLSPGMKTSVALIPTVGPFILLASLGRKLVRWG